MDVEILIVEDSPTQREELQYLLESEGYRVVSAGDGHEALALVRSRRPTAVISDIVMPGMDGYALCRFIKSDEELAQTPVILLTSLSSPHDILKSLECGADNFIRKPYEEEYLLARVGSILAGRRLREGEKLQMGIEVYLAGQKHFITSDRQQILDFLLSTYEEVAQINDELELRQAELERALAELAQEKERIEAFYRFGKRTSAEVDVEALARTILAELVAFVGADRGSIYVHDEEEGALVLTAAYGADPARLPAQLSDPGGGADIGSGHELRLSLAGAERQVGMLMLARSAERPFTPSELGAIEHLAAQCAAVSLSNAIVLRRALRLASINRAVLDAAPTGIALFDVDGRLRLVNATMEELAAAIGLPPEGTIYERLAAVADRTTDSERFAAEVEAIAADPEREETYEYELADSGRSFQRFTAPVRDGSGAVIGRLFMLREVTAEREVERLKSELVATVSHELRTPLTGILGFSELLVRQELDAPTRERYLSLIHKEARRLTKLVNDFLDLQRIEVGRFTLTLQPVELGELLREEVELHSGQSSAHDLRLDVPGESLSALCDPERIGQVIGNLLSNAIKYSPTGGPIGVAAEVVDGFIRVSVSDRGLGIPAEQQRKLFTKFFRVDSSDTRRIGGTGLGLALCREIVEAHGGRIGFESVEGEGSTFWFELPSKQRVGAGKRVLVVDDEPALAALLSEWLAADGHAVETVATGEMALARAREDPPSVICLDVNVRGRLDGWQVLAALRVEASTARIPVVVCTGGNGRDKAAALGAADFLTKPFSGDELRRAIGRLLPAGRGSVLVVDDEETVRRLVAETLGPDGFEIREAADGEEALEAVAALRPDAVVLDLLMPRLDGFAVLERLQAEPETRALPVVVLTGKRLTAAERNLLSSRAVSLLEKSAYSAVELRRLVRTALGSAPSQ